MIKALILQQFPKLSVKGMNDTSNTGNFLVRTSNGKTLWPYGFVTTNARQRRYCVSHCGGVRILLVGLIFFSLNYRSTYVCLIMTDTCIYVCVFERAGIVAAVNIRVQHFYNYH